MYLDNSATTKPCETSIRRMEACLTTGWGNPSSTHALGLDAFQTLQQARMAVARSVGARPDEIVFTGSGTEANNTALKGAAYALRKQGNRLITTTIEHPSVLQTMAFLEQNGFEVIYLQPDETGIVSPDAFAQAVNQQTILVSAMLVNNEVGSIHDIAAISKAVKAKNERVLVHCDAVQGYGKLPISVNSSGIDLLSASGHKIHGPKGIGFLYHRKGLHLPPLLHGGGQESQLRSGTEPMPLIAGLWGAVEELPDLDRQLKITGDLRQFAIDTLTATGLITVNSPADSLPYILNLSVNGYKAEPLLNALSSRGICVSTGSACAKGHRSYVLEALHLPADRIDSALRLSFSRFNTKEDITALAQALTEICRTLRKFR